MSQMQTTPPGAPSPSSAPPSPPPEPSGQPPAQPSEPGSQPGTTPSAPPAPGDSFRWDASLPEEGRPDVFKPYKTFAEVANAHKELRTTLNQRASRITELESNLSEAQKALERAANGQQISEEQQRILETRQLWQASINHYFENQQADDATIQQLMARTGLDRQALLDHHEVYLQKRNSFLATAKERHPDVDVPTLEKWVKAGESPYPQQVMDAFYVLADKGYTEWLTLVQKDYESYLERGGRPVAGAAQPHPLTRGRPASPQGVEGFKTREEYQRALYEANNDPAKEAEIRKRLEASDTSKWG